MKIALVHEMLIKFGGAERVLMELMRMYPEASVFTLMYDEKKMRDFFPKNRIWYNTLAQTLFTLTGKPRMSLPLMPASVAKIDLRGYDLVISSSSGFAHGVWVPPGVRHVCYCHSPARYLWDATEEVQKELGAQMPENATPLQKIKASLAGPLVRGLFSYLRKWDEAASKKPTLYIANSKEVQQRIQLYYHRGSEILWPPIETSRFESGSVPVSKRKYYVVTSALTPFKKIDRVIRVATRLNIRVKIIGDGAQKQALEKLAGTNIEFLGRVSDTEIVKIYKEARGFLMPQKEDAGIAPLEAMAAGVPVFGFGQGGLLETNIDGVTGRFYREDTDESFLQGLQSFDREIEERKFDSAETIINRAREFDEVHFREKFRLLLQGE